MQAGLPAASIGAGAGTIPVPWSGGKGEQGTLLQLNQTPEGL